jgi:hypothetical protein
MINEPGRLLSSRGRQAPALITISIGGTSLDGGGFLVNHLDVAPLYARVDGHLEHGRDIPEIIGVAATGFMRTTPALRSATSSASAEP